MCRNPHCDEYDEKATELCEDCREREAWIIKWLKDWFDAN